MGQPLQALKKALAGAAGVILFCGATALAQEPMPTAPSSPEFMSRFDFRMWGAKLAYDDPRFVWDTHWAGDFDLVDYKYGRATFVADYEALLGNEYRPFDPYQSNYLLEAAGSIRLPQVEMYVVLNHVSRHLGDRPKRIAVAENSLGPRFLRRLTSDATTFDLRGDWRKVIEKAYMDYSWIGTADLTVRHPVNERASLYGLAVGETYLIDKTISTRDTQYGFRLESGVRVQGTVAAMDFFGGVQRMVDADPLDRMPRTWFYAGFRLVGK
jgi:hypothetical protein